MVSDATARGAVQDAEDQEDGDDDPSLITVELGPKFRNRIFHEYDEGHPGGQVLVVAGRRVRVRHTARVREALGSGVLVTSRKEPTAAPPEIADLLDQQRTAAREAEEAEAAALIAAKKQAQAAIAAAASSTGGGGQGEGSEGDPASPPRATKKP
jgi:hypothetical protein